MFGLVVRSRGLGGNIDGRPPLDRGRRDPRVHEPARGHPAPGHRPDGPERDARGRERRHLDALRLVGAGRDDVRDRGLRHRRRRRARDGGDARARRPRRPSSSPPWASRSSGSSSASVGVMLLLGGIAVAASRAPAATCSPRCSCSSRAPSRSRRSSSSGPATGRSHAESTGDGHGPGGGEPGTARATLPAHRRAVRRPDDRGRDARLARPGDGRAAVRRRSADAGTPVERGPRTGRWYPRWPGRDRAADGCRHASRPPRPRALRGSMATVRPAPGPRIAGRPRRRPQPGAEGADPQPRAVVDRVQRPRPPRGAGHPQPAARAGEVPRDLRRQPRRVLPGPRVGPPPPGSRATAPT